MPSPRRKVTARTVAESAVRHSSLATPMSVSGNKVLRRAHTLASRIKHKNIIVTNKHIRSAAHVVAKKLKKQGKTKEGNRLNAGVLQQSKNMVRSVSPTTRKGIRDFIAKLKANHALLMMKRP
jgi:hypothetical protein